MIGSNDKHIVSQGCVAQPPIRHCGTSNLALASWDNIAILRGNNQGNWLNLDGPLGVVSMDICTLYTIPREGRFATCCYSIDNYFPYLSKTPVLIQI